jgi:flagellar basal body-associated protein FliL
VTPILIVAILILVLGAVSGATMSAFRKEKRSIESHKRTMSVMEDLAHGASGVTEHHVAGQTPRQYAHVRTVGANGSSSTRSNSSSSAPDEGRGVRLRPPLPPQGAQETEGRDRRNLSERRVRQRGAGDIERTGSSQRSNALSIDEPTVEMQRVVFDDVHGAPREVSTPSGAERRSKGRHVSSGTGRVSSLIVVVIVGVVAVTGVVFEISKSKPLKALVAAQKTKTSSSGTSASSSTTTSTTQPTQLTASSTSSGGADFHVTASALTVVLHASAPCWVEESATPYGKIVWASTLGAGQSYTISTSAPLWLRTGNVGVLSMTVNGLPVSVSAPPGAYNFSFSQAS